MSATVRNLLRLKSIMVSRQYKALFRDGAEARRPGEAVIADLREYGFIGKSAFDSDAFVMARREGRREVVLRILNFLKLDEDDVQSFMEVDDGL